MDGLLLRVDGGATKTVALIAEPDGTIVGFAMGQLTVKIGDKEEKIPLQGVKLLDAEGKEITGGAARREALKKDVKVDIKKEGDKVVEIKIKK